MKPRFSIEPARSEEDLGGVGGVNPEVAMLEEEESTGAAMVGGKSERDS